jgi:hypothetical protein
MFIDLSVGGHMGPGWLGLIVPRWMGHEGVASTVPGVERHNFILKAVANFVGEHFEGRYAGKLHDLQDGNSIMHAEMMAIPFRFLHGGEEPSTVVGGELLEVVHPLEPKLRPDRVS